MASKVQCLEWVNGGWSLHSFLLEQLPKRPQRAEVTIIFLDLEISTQLLSVDTRRIPAPEYLTQRYGVPTKFWSFGLMEACGFFGSEEQFTHPSLNGIDTWFRFTIKEAKATVGIKSKFAASQDDKIEYNWQLLRFVTHWESPNKATVLCIGLPDDLQRRLISSFQSRNGTDEIKDPFRLHSIFVSEIAFSYDNALWPIRDLVRNIEKNRPRAFSSPPRPDYATMHEIARHVIHASETLENALNIVACMLRDHARFASRNPSMVKDSGRSIQRTTESLQIDESFLKCLHVRSKALEERLRNEMNLAFNTVSQYDSAVQVRIGEATQSDSTAMKMISFLGFFFLPATFLSAVFSTSFFTLSPGDDTHAPRWIVSDKFYIYWATAIPVTILISLMGLLWLKFFAQRGFQI